MEKSTEKMLEEVIKEELSFLSDYEVDGEERANRIDDLVKLYKLKIEETKCEREFYEREEKRIVDMEQYESDLNVKKSQLAEQIKDRQIKMCLTTAELILPLILYAVWMEMGFKFEETGTFTSTTFRGLFNRFRATKK